jgi:hypothetical protein
MTTSNEAQVTIIATKVNEEYFLTYQFEFDVSSEVKAAIEQRLRKSFYLDTLRSEAKSERGIVRKATLMQTIFRITFGLEALISYEFNRG